MLVSRKISLKSKISKIQNLFDEDFYPIFICGVAGSGTTLLSSLLDQRYENAGLLNESALMAPSGSVLKMNSVASYGSLNRYYEAMPIPDNVSTQEVHASLIKLYRKIACYPKSTNIIIDKAPNVHLVRAKRLREAFASSKFLMIFRDPVSNIEGLRRKWPVFAQAELVEVCNFWESTHKIFLEETRAFFNNDVMILSYEALTNQAEATLEQLAKFCGLQRRAIPKTYPDRPNIPGKGLRNVINGCVEITPPPAARSTLNLSPQECDYIQQRLVFMYDQLSVAAQKRVS